MIKINQVHMGVDKCCHFLQMEVDKKSQPGFMLPESILTERNDPTELSLTPRDIINILVQDNHGFSKSFIHKVNGITFNLW